MSFLLTPHLTPSGRINNAPAYTAPTHTQRDFGIGRGLVYCMLPQCIRTERLRHTFFFCPKHVITQCEALRYQRAASLPLVNRYLKKDHLRSIKGSTATMEYYSALKRKAIHTHVRTWMTLEAMMLTKVSQAHKHKNHRQKGEWLTETGVEDSC